MPEPIFTPATKADVGNHDENIDFETVKTLIGEKIANKIRNISLKIYNEAAEYGIGRGIIIADTKFEFGMIDGEFITNPDPDELSRSQMNIFMAGRQLFLYMEVNDYAEAARILGASPESVRWEEYMEPIMEDAGGETYDPENPYPASLPEVFFWRRGK